MNDTIWKPPSLITRHLVPPSYNGDQNGNICEPACQHNGCQFQRAFAERPCVGCGQPLGLNTRYYPTNPEGTKLYFTVYSWEMKPGWPVIHEACVVWENIE